MKLFCRWWQSRAAKVDPWASQSWHGYTRWSRDAAGRSCPFLASPRTEQYWQCAAQLHCQTDRTTVLPLHAAVWQVPSWYVCRHVHVHLCGWKGEPVQTCAQSACPARRWEIFMQLVSKIVSLNSLFISTLFGTVSGGDDGDFINISSASDDDNLQRKATSSSHFPHKSCYNIWLKLEIYFTEQPQGTHGMQLRPRPELQQNIVQVNIGELKFFAIVPPFIDMVITTVSSMPIIQHPVVQKVWLVLYPNVWEEMLRSLF